MRVLFAGLGAVGQRHLRNLCTVVGSDLEIAAWRVRGRATVITEGLELDLSESVEVKYGIRVFERLETALETFHPDLVFVCNPTSHHLPVALAAARAGAHLLIEKPLCVGLEGAEELARIVEEKSLTALVGFQMRFHPCLLRLRQRLADGVIGRVVAVEARCGEYLPDFHPYEDYRQSYAAREDLGGGVILTQIHDLDYLHSLFGSPRRVFALGGHLSALEIDVEDVASIAMDGASDGRRIPIHLLQDFVTRCPVRKCSILGENGTMEVDFRAPSFTRRAARGEVVESVAHPEFRRNDMFVHLLRHLLACLAGAETPVVGVRDAIQTQRVALAARESLHSGRVVELTPAGDW